GLGALVGVGDAGAGEAQEGEGGGFDPAGGGELGDQVLQLGQELVIGGGALDQRRDRLLVGGVGVGAGGGEAGHPDRLLHVGQAAVAGQGPGAGHGLPEQEGVGGGDPGAEAPGPAGGQGPPAAGAFPEHRQARSDV